MSKNDELILIAPDERRHASAVFDLTGKVFAHEGYYRWLKGCRRDYFARGPYDWSASTIGLVNGEVVTHFGVWGHEMRVGVSRLRVAGVGAVATHGFFRKGGYMRRTIEAALPRMRDRGYDVTWLAGIPDFYDKFGYVHVWETPTYFVDVGRLPPGNPAAPLRRFAPQSRPDLDELYNRQSAELAGTAVRPTYRGRRRAEWQGYLWRDARGRPAGYVIVQPSRDSFALIDHAGDAEEVLTALRVLVQRAGALQVRMPDLHWECELARRLRAGFCRIDTTYRRSGGAMIRTLNLASSLGHLCPELSRRLRASSLADWKGRLLIADPRETVTLEIARSKVTVADPHSRAGSGGGPSVLPAAPKTRHALRGGEEIVQLLVGTYAAAEAIDLGRMRATGDAAALAEVLFPARHPTMSSWDLY